MRGIPKEEVRSPRKTLCFVTTTTLTAGFTYLASLVLLSGCHSSKILSNGATVSIQVDAVCLDYIDRGRSLRTSRRDTPAHGAIVH